MSKYEPLRHYLLGLSKDQVSMTFAEIEKVLGFKLPDSQKYPAWWSNSSTNNVMTNEWLQAGYRTEQVDIEGRKLVFRSVKQADTAPKSNEQSPSAPVAGSVGKPRRNPLFGWMKGTITIMPGTDLTEPADPDWAEIAWGKSDGFEDQKER